MGSKVQRRNQHIRKLKSKIRRFKVKNWKIEGLVKELGYALGETDRPDFPTGTAADVRNKKKY
jgi:hypothetical protein